MFFWIKIIFFLLFLTGAFIPKDIESIITGLKICLNPFSYFQSNSGGDSNFVSNFFDFGLGNSNLEKLGIKSDSTIVNIYSFILSMIIIWVLHLWIHYYIILIIVYICCKIYSEVFKERESIRLLNKIIIFCSFSFNKTDGTFYICVI